MGRYRRLIPFARRQWRRLFLIVLLTIATSATAVLQPWPMKLLVDSALDGKPLDATVATALDSLHISYASPASLVVFAALASLLLFALNCAIDIGLSLTWTSAGQRMVFDLATALFDRLQRLSLLFHARQSVGDSLARITGDAWCVYTVTEAVLVAPVQHVVTLVLMGVVAYRLDPSLALVALAVTPVLGASAFYFGRVLKRRARMEREATSHLTSFVHQTLTAIPVVQAFGTEEHNREQFEELASRSIALSQKGVFIKSSFGLVNGLATTTGVAVVLFLGGRRVLEHQLTLGGLLVFLAYINSLRAASQGLLSTYANLRAAEASVDRVVEVLDAKEVIAEKPGAKPAPAGNAAGHVRFEDVTFGYETGRPVLRGVNLEAKPGQLVALVGATGAGKSTLASLIPRFFDPWEGVVSLGGNDLRDLQLASVRERVALVPQETFLLPLSIAENIAFGRPDAPRADIIAAAKAANADEFITALPQGYDSLLGERGASLSGGQRQRISIARALLKNAPILILDEPTAALDAGTESLVLQAIERLMANRTTFVIAHRLSTVRKADQILVLDNGVIAERGTHDQLIASGGLYHKLSQLQFQGATLPSFRGIRGAGEVTA